MTDGIVDGVPGSLPRLLADLEVLRLDGHLDARGSDLLTIAGLGRSELSHSAVIAWLLDPNGSHGLGARCLHAVLAAGWDLEVADIGSAVGVELEVTRVETRADIVVEFGSGTLIVENKVDAPEQQTQCDDFYREWGSGVLYLLLSPTGARPLSAHRAETRAAWRSLSYGAFAKLLAELRPQADGPGREALTDYLETLRRQFPPQERFFIHREDGMSDDDRQDATALSEDLASDPFDTPRLRFYLEHRAAIDEFRALESDFLRAFNLELQALLGPIEAGIAAMDGPISGTLANWSRTGVDHPLCWRSSWTDAAGAPAAAIGVAADRADPTSRRGLYCGVFAAPSSLGQRLRKRLADEARSAADGDWVEGLYPVAYRYLPAVRDDWWTDVPVWRAGVVEAVIAAWQRFAVDVDRAIASIGDDVSALGPDPRT